MRGKKKGRWDIRPGIRLSCSLEGAGKRPGPLSTDEKGRNGKKAPFNRGTGMGSRDPLRLGSRRRGKEKCFRIPDPSGKDTKSLNRRSTFNAKKRRREGNLIESWTLV